MFCFVHNPKIQFTFTEDKKTPENIHVKEAEMREFYLFSLFFFFLSF